MQRILITGCAGFIGSHLTDKLLSKGLEIIGIDNFDDFYSRQIKENNIIQALKNENFTFIEGDICNKDNLKKITGKINLVIHLAAKVGVRSSILYPGQYINTNINGTKNILNWMNEKNVRKLIFASSSSVYGNNAKIPFSERNNVDNPISPYAFTKKSCELLNYTYHHLYNIDVVNLRFFTVYGPRQRPDLAIRKFTDLIRNNKTIPMFGDGTTSRDYTFIDDIIQGIENTIQYLSESTSKVYDIINLGNSTPTKLIDLIKILHNLQNKEVKINQLPMQEGDVNHTCANISKAQKLINYSPRTPVEIGLQKFIYWYASKLEANV